MVYESWARAAKNACLIQCSTLLQAKAEGLTAGRKHRTAALQAAEVIAFQAEQAELADLAEEEDGALEHLNRTFDPLTSQVAKGPRTIRKRNPEDHAGAHTAPLRWTAAHLDTDAHGRRSSFLKRLSHTCSILLQLSLQCICLS